MKITRKSIEVKFADAQEAARFIGGYAGAPEGSAAHRDFKTEFSGLSYAEKTAALEAAIALLAKDRNVGTVEPTWTSRKGETFRLKDMPTPYLEAAVRFARMQVIGDNYASGLARAIERELSTRADFVNRRG